MDKNTFTKLSYGMYAICTKDNERFCGCIANSAMQITSEPATIAVSINHDNYTNEQIKKYKEFSLCVLGEKINPLIKGTFGFRSARDFDKFKNTEYFIKNGLPVCKEACAYFICKLIDFSETKTHTVFIAQVCECEILKDETPMTYSYYHNVIKGKSPKNAPTYISPEI